MDFSGSVGADAGPTGSSRRPGAPRPTCRRDLGADDVEQDILSDLASAEPRTVMVAPRVSVGRAGRSPGSVEVGADIDRRGPNSGERDVPAAFLTGRRARGRGAWRRS